MSNELIKDIGKAIISTMLGLLFSMLLVNIFNIEYSIFGWSDRFALTLALGIIFIGICIYIFGATRINQDKELLQNYLDIVKEWIEKFSVEEPTKQDVLHLLMVREELIDDWLEPIDNKRFRSKLDPQLHTVFIEVMGLYNSTLLAYSVKTGVKFCFSGVCKGKTKCDFSLCSYYEES